MTDKDVFVTNLVRTNVTATLSKIEAISEMKTNLKNGYVYSNEELIKLLDAYARDCKNLLA